MRRVIWTLITVTLLFGAAAAQSDPRRVALAWIDDNAETLKRITRNIWTFAEIGLQETRSSGELQAALRAHGFDVQPGVAGMPTAFVASWGSGRPIIGLLAEYDALPGLSQAAVSERAARIDAPAGHGCGHNVLGTASMGAAIALRRALEAANLEGTVRLYGTPAEESGIGKTYMLREGMFKDADIILSWHPSAVTRAVYAYTKANVSVKFRFEGRAAHASTAPSHGRSALDAVELMSVGVNYMREHVKEDTRIQYVITDGGGQPNVVPPAAEVWYYLRANRHADVEEYFTWLKEIAQAAAAMSRTTLAAVQVEADTHEVLPNRTLAELIHASLETVGAPAFTADEKAFARATQADLERDLPLALSERIEPLRADPEQALFSTDVGDISWFVPVGQLTATTHTFGAPEHSWQIVACTGTSIGEKGMMLAAKALAGAAIALYQSPDLVHRAKADFEAIRKPLPYTTLIPEGRRAPAATR